MCLGEGLTTYFDLKTVKLDLVKVLSKSASNTGQREEGERLLKDGVCLFVCGFVVCLFSYCVWLCLYASCLFVNSLLNTLMASNIF